jgi:hypothetical protein
MWRAMHRNGNAQQRPSVSDAASLLSALVDLVEQVLRCRRCAERVLVRAEEHRVEVAVEFATSASMVSRRIRVRGMRSASGSSSNADRGQ